MAQGTAEELMQDLVLLTVENSLHLPDVATVVVHDTRLKWVDEAGLEPGKGLKVRCLPGSEGSQEQVIFDGEIVEIEPEFSASAQRLQIRAFDRLHRLARGQQVRSFQNVSDADLVRRLAQEVGLQSNVSGGNVVHDYVFQNNQTNLAFLQERAAAQGCLLYVEGRTLRYGPPSSTRGTVQLAWGQTLRTFQPRLTTLDQLVSTSARGWDPKQKQAIVAQSSTPQTAPELQSGQRDGGQAAKRAFSIDAKGLVAEAPLRKQALADKVAQGRLEHHASRFVEAEGVAAGDSRLVAGCHVELDNVGTRFKGKYLVTASRHVYREDKTYETEFTISGLQPATLLGLLRSPAGVPPNRGLVIGIVTDNNDPEKMGRVKVKYPWLSADHASDWARVVAVGAGNARGIQYLPEVNDEVLVGFEQGDIHFPYVLGGLWNGKDAPPESAAVTGSGVVKRVIQSRAGHKIILDDTDGGGGITIEDKGGNVIKIETAQNTLTVSMKGDANVKAQGNMTLEATGNLSIKASGRVDVQGQAGLKLESSAVAELKGAMVNIN